MIWGIVAMIGIYLAGWVFAARCFSLLDGPVPAPGRLGRDLRDGLLWPLWLFLYALFWLIELRPQAFEDELGGD